MKPLVRLSVLYGILAGLLAFGYFLVLYKMGLPPLSGKKEPGVLAIWVLMLLALWRYLKRYANGPLHFWEGFALCLLTALVGGIVDGGLIAGFLQYVDYQVLLDYIAESKQLVLAGKAEYFRSAGSDTSRQLLDFDKLVKSLDDVTPGTIWRDDATKKVLLTIVPSALFGILFRRLSL